MLLVSFFTSACWSQGTPAVDLATSADGVQQPGLLDVPWISGALHGANASLTMTGLHDSITGWATLANPAVGYGIGDHYSINVAVPIYLYRLAQTRSLKPRPNAELVVQRAEIGDVVFDLQAAFAHPFVDYQATASVTAPTGDTDYGLSTGRVTFDLSNHFERNFGRLTPNVEIGMGDSSTLVNPLITKNYTSLGPLAHFQAGFALDLIRSLSMEAAAYEQLPIGDQKTYGPARKGRATVVTGRNVAEDNGFTASIYLPLDRHTLVSTYYNRSLRLHEDTVAVGVTYSLRPAPKPEVPDASLDDIFK